MPGGDLPRLAEYQPPARAAAPSVAATMPPTVVPAGGFAALGTPGVPRQHPAPVRPPTLRRLVATTTVVLATMLNALLTFVIFRLVVMRHRYDDGAQVGHEIDVLFEIGDRVVKALDWAVIASVVAVLIWCHATVRTAARRHPRARLGPWATVFTFFIPIGNMWMPWNHLRAAGECDGGGSPRGLTAWHMLWIFGIIGRVVGSGLVRTQLDDSDPSWTLVLTVLVASAVLTCCECAAAVVAMHHTDLATSGLALPGTATADSTTPVPATA